MNWFAKFFYKDKHVNVDVSKVTDGIFSEDEMEYWFMKHSAIMADIAQDRYNAFKSDIVKIDYTIFDYNDGKFHCPYIPLNGDYL